MNYATTKTRKPTRFYCFLELPTVIFVMMMFGKATRSSAFLGSSSASRSARSALGISSVQTTTHNYNGPSTTTLFRGFQNSRLYSSKASSPDESAISKSRAPFRMPKNSADDSSQENNDKNDSNNAAGTNTSLSWNRMGLLTEICTCLQDELKLPTPTPVQSLVIPQLLKPEKESMAFLAATGYVCSNMLYQRKELTCMRMMCV